MPLWVGLARAKIAMYRHQSNLMSDESSPFRVEPAEGGFRFSLDVHARTAERQTKVATFDKFTIHCDEGAAIGGDNTAPPPLAYFASSIAF